MTEVYLIALANLAMCLSSVVIMLCRLNAMGSNVRRIVVVEYAVGVGAMFVSALRPLIGEWPGYASLAVAFFVLVQLIASAPAWRGDTPPDIATAPAPLDVLKRVE
jgi:hypothetical protein